MKREDKSHEEIKSIKILQGTFGCPSGQHADIDPYYDASDWSESARGDGMSYSGVLETVHRSEGESWEDFYQRAQDRANVHDSDLRCSRCSF